VSDSDASIVLSDSVSSDISIVEHPAVIKALENPSVKTLKTVLRQVMPHAKAQARARIAGLFYHMICGNTIAVALAKQDMHWVHYQSHAARNTKLTELYELIRAIQLTVIKISRENALQVRAVEGWDEPVWHRGIQVGVIRKFSDKLLEKALAASDPDKYSDKKAPEINLNIGIAFESVGVDHSLEQPKAVDVDPETGEIIPIRVKTGSKS